MRTDAGTEEGYHVNCLACICELEAELVTVRAHADESYYARQMQARAEKAEAELMDQKRGYDELWLRNRKAEARVGELEELLAPYRQAAEAHRAEWKAREKEG